MMTMRVYAIFDSYGDLVEAVIAASEKEAVKTAFSTGRLELADYVDFQLGGRVEEFLPGFQSGREKQLEETLNHAVECCSAFQSGGKFDHLARLGESVFDAVPRLVNLAVEKGLG